MFKTRNAVFDTDLEEDLAHAGRRLVVRLWLAGAVVAASTALLHLPAGG